MKLLKKVLGILHKDKPKQEIEIEDLREQVTPLDKVKLADEDDPVLEAVLNAAWTGKGGVSASLEDGKLTITDLKED